MDLRKDTSYLNHIEKKGGFDYISWAYAWEVFKTKYPKGYASVVVNYDIGLPVFGNPEMGYMVQVVVGEKEGGCVTEWYAITDYKNQTIKTPTTADINSAIKRATTKAIAEYCGFGLGLYQGESADTTRQEMEISELAVQTGSDSEKIKNYLYTHFGNNVQAGISQLKKLAEQKKGEKQND